jgi:hypothetical protein
MASIVVRQYAPDKGSILAGAHENKLKSYGIDADAEARRILVWGAYFWGRYRRVISNRSAAADLVSASSKISAKSISIALATLVAFWAPVCLALPHRLGAERWAPSVLWLFVIIGAWGLGSVLYTCWKDTRDHAWRAAHGLPPRQSNSTTREIS